MLEKCYTMANVWKETNNWGWHAFLVTLPQTLNDFDRIPDPVEVFSWNACQIWLWNDPLSNDWCPMQSWQYGHVYWYSTHDLLCIQGKSEAQMKRHIIKQNLYWENFFSTDSWFSFGKEFYFSHIVIRRKAILWKGNHTDEPVKASRVESAEGLSFKLHVSLFKKMFW